MTHTSIVRSEAGFPPRRPRRSAARLAPCLRILQWMMASLANRHGSSPLSEQQGQGSNIAGTGSGRHGWARQGVVVNPAAKKVQHLPNADLGHARSRRG